MPDVRPQSVWVSNSSISDFVNCPRLYYLRNVYKDPKTNHKINIISPALALGQMVHDVLEALSFLPAEERFKESLLDKYSKSWEKVSGKLGGFKTQEEEDAIKERGLVMLKRVIENPGPIRNKTIKVRKEDPHYLPRMTLSEEDNIILCGKIDWLEYLPATDSVHIIDFKTGKNDEKPDSLQLPIYHLIVKNFQNRPVSKASYWYLERNNDLTEVQLPNLEDAKFMVLSIAKQMKKAREHKEFVCRRGGCFSCEPFEAILQGEAEFVGTGGYSQDMYVLK